MARWEEAIGAISRYHFRSAGVQKWLFLWLKPDQDGGAAPGYTDPPEKCIVRHITPHCMGEPGLGPFLPITGTYPGFQGSKNGYFYG